MSFRGKLTFVIHIPGPETALERSGPEIPWFRTSVSVPAPHSLALWSLDIFVGVFMASLTRQQMNVYGCTCAGLRDLIPMTVAKEQKMTKFSSVALNNWQKTNQITCKRHVCTLYFPF